MNKQERKAARQAKQLKPPYIMLYNTHIAFSLLLLPLLLLAQLCDTHSTHFYGYT